ncbi:MAG TPA: serine/threonine-protein kinase [Candidatus Acidoferrales bacterium]|nr:serine/threonine-protein kinase [Candidatus Acidoferrales bacterium]
MSETDRSRKGGPSSGTDGPANSALGPDAPNADAADASDSVPAADADVTLDNAGTARSPRSAGSSASRAISVTPESKSIGPYRLLQLLGEGGMGEVWLAEQKKPIQRTVALKLIKAGMDTKAVVARFESERQALALMDHRNIARVFEAGSTAEGRPYFVMEYVPGFPITEYCDKRRLTMKDRLALFLQVCDGVQHAHQRAIIHRDLKPSNVLVVEREGKAVPKIIDFGLAKATAQRLTDKTLFTELGVMMGTPEYMSPEQADQHEQNIDTRTDVYSLGIILYQLLVGVLPFDAKTFRAAGLEAILRLIREQEPPKPSMRVRTLGPASAVTAELRQEQPQSFAGHLQGELDWITMRALEKDRNRRYGSPSELSADIGRYLRNEPVLAHPPSAGYRASKFVRRHRAAVAAASAMVVLLIAFAAAMAIQARRIAAERDRANQQAELAKRVADFMEGMFKVSDPSEARGNSITAREILDNGSKQIDTGLAKDPETQAQLMGVMGEVYQNLGLYPRAQTLLEHALDTQRRIHGPRNRDTLKAANNLAWLLTLEGDFPGADKLARETLDTARQVLGPDDPETLTSMRRLSSVLFREGHYSQAESMTRDVLERERRVLGPEAPETLATINNLAVDLGAEGRYAEVEKVDRDLLDARRRVSGTDNPNTLSVMDSLATNLQHEGKYAESEKMLRDALDIQHRVEGPEHPDTLRTLSILGSTLEQERRFAEAEKIDRELLDAERRVLGPEHPDTLLTMGNLAGVLGDQGRNAEAEKMFRNLVEIQTRVLGPDHPQTAEAVYNVGVAEALQGHKNEALSFLRRAVDHGLPAEGDIAIDKDPDLKSLHGDPRFAAIVADAQQHLAAQKPN